jgi:membrane protein
MAVLRSGLFALAVQVRDAASAAFEHDALTLAQATAYSAIVALFPGLIVAAAVVRYVPDAAPLRGQMAHLFNRVLPPDVSPLLDAYFTAAHRSAYTTRALLGSLLVSLTGATAVVSTLMEGFRRAYDLPLPRGSFWPRRVRALAMVPLSLVPMTAATMLVVFGHEMTRWLVSEVTVDLRPTVRVVSFLLRWTIALAGSVGIIGVIYHLGTDMTTQMRQHLEPLLREPWQAFRRDWSWRASLPGATLATVLWFVSTLIFGFYVTRFANYSQIYGSLGAAIALMFWLYIIALSVLVGAEFNAHRATHGPMRRAPEDHELLWKMPGLRQRKTGRMAD